MSTESKAGLGVLLLGALLAVLVIDTFPRKYRPGLLPAVCVLACASWGWLCL
jgi:hypothetical protein